MNQPLRVIRRRASRSGVLLLELIIAGLLLGVVMSMAIPTLGLIARQRQATRQRQVAILAVGNLMERMTLLDWNELTQEHTQQVQLPESLKNELSEAKLTITVTAAESPTEVRRVHIELQWEIAPSRPAPVVHLTAWIHHPSV